MKEKIKSAMIIGGSRIAFYLAKQLAEIGIKVKIIDNDEKICEKLSALYRKQKLYSRWYRPRYFIRRRNSTYGCMCIYDWYR